MTWRQKDLKPQAASLLGKKHSSVSLVSTSAKARNETKTPSTATATTATMTTPALDSVPKLPIRRRLFNWSARKSSFYEDEQVNRAHAGGKLTLLRRSAAS